MTDAAFLHGSIFGDGGDKRGERESVRDCIAEALFGY